MCLPPAAYRRACTEKPPSSRLRIQLHHHSSHQKRPFPLTHKSWPLCHPLPLPTVGALEQASEPVSTVPPDTPKQQVLARNDLETRKALSLTKEVPGSWLGFLTSPRAIILELTPSIVADTTSPPQDQVPDPGRLWEPPTEVAKSPKPRQPAMEREKC